MSPKVCRFLTRPFVVGMLFFLAGCVAHVQQRGYIPDMKAWKSLHTGMTMDETKSLLGAPSFRSLMPSKAWYYVTEKTKRVSFYHPDVLYRYIFVVNFGQDGRLSNVYVVSRDEGLPVTNAPFITQPKGYEEDPLQEFVSNIGRFNEKTPAS